MYKNAEGYRDETAWLAIMAVMKEERKHKSVNYPQPKGSGLATAQS